METPLFIVHCNCQADRARLSPGNLTIFGIPIRFENKYLTLITCQSPSYGGLINKEPYLINVLGFVVIVEPQNDRPTKKYLE